MKVCSALKEGDIEKARKAVSMIVGRDTAVLDRDGIARAAVETVAENTSDGVIAPFFFMAVFGPAGGFFYKAVNTMDSMVGYKNETYLLFGRAAAKLDDAVNWLPARLSGMLLTAAAGFFREWMENAWRIFKRDRFNHASPNSAQGEAACAGALHLRLAGDAWYFGTLYKKPYIGDDDRPIRPDDIKGVCQPYVWSSGTFDGRPCDITFVTLGELMEIPYTHGGDIYSHPIKMDYSANINPLGLPGRGKERAALLRGGKCMLHLSGQRLPKLKNGFIRNTSCSKGVD